MEFREMAIASIGRAAKECDPQTTKDWQHRIEAILVVASVHFCVTNGLSPTLAGTFSEAAYNAMRNLAVTLN